MRLNRVWIAVGVVLVAVTFYEVRLRPQTRPLYQSALSLYRQERYAASLQELERAYEIDPNSTGILILMGWNHLKLHQYNEARENFSRAHRLDGALIDPQLGLACVALETGKGDVPLAGVQALMQQDPKNMDFVLAAAAALRQSGHNLEAQKMFERLMGHGKYGDLARKNLEEMYGLEGLNEEIPKGLPPVERPSQLRVDFRANGNYLQARSGGSWAPFYVKGVNLSPAVPGSFPSEAPARAEQYLDWLSQIAKMGGNTVRAYTILPPAFYWALKIHNEKTQEPHLYLLQQVWLVESETENLFESAARERARTGIRYAVDVIHGQGDVPPRKGQASGLYASDVSAYTLGLLLGRVIEPHLVVANNEANSFRKTYQGKYVGVEQGNATEAWLASMADFAADFETEKYNQQRPLGIVSWPGLDPLSHPTEAGLLEEISIRRKLGEGTPRPPAGNKPVDDNDAVSVDEMHLQAHREFQGGLFSAYTVFPFYPDFMFREPGYLAVRDQQGPNPFFGYLKALKAHYKSLPVLAGEYGLSTSLGISHLHPLGWNQGGLSEREQGDLLARMTRNIADAGLAGGLISTWQDEWYRANWLTGALALPMDRRPLWNNRLDPDQGFGLWTYDPAADAQLFSAFSGWNSVAPLYQKSKGAATALNDGWDSERTLRSLAVSSDAAFVYLRLQVDRVRKGPNNVPDLKGAHYYIGISTASGRFGGRVLPGLMPRVRAESGANFLLDLGEDGRARLLIASNYNPREFKPIPGAASTLQSGYRIPFAPSLEERTGFEEMVVETDSRHFGRDGRVFPPQRYDQGLLRYRPANDTSDSLATWTCDFANNAFIFRLPWALLMVMDPSSHRVFASTEEGPQFASLETKGLELFAVSFRPAGPIQFQQLRGGGTPALDSLPSRDDLGSLTGLRTYSWPGWDTIKVQGRLKSGYARVQKVFRELRAPSS